MFSRQQRRLVVTISLNWKINHLLDYCIVDIINLLFHPVVETTKTVTNLLSCSKSLSISDPCEYSTFLQSRPDVMEVEAVRMVTELCLQYQ